MKWLKKYVWIFLCIHLPNKIEYFCKTLELAKYLLGTYLQISGIHLCVHSKYHVSSWYVLGKYQVSSRCV